MKKIIATLSLLLALTMLLGACGASASKSDGAYVDNGYFDGAAEAPQAAPAEAEMAAEEGWYDEDVEMADWNMEKDSLSASGSTATADAPEAEALTEGQLKPTENLSDKIIYTAYAEIETTEFDTAVESVYTLMDRYGAFLESSSVTGSNITDTYYGSVSNRTASFTLRVPKDKYAAITGALDTVGNVTYLSSNADNITAQYTDTASRLKAYETEEERLLEIMAQADTVEDMIALESRLSEIRYEKEWLTSQLRNWDNQIAYSTVNLNLREVKILTPEPPVEKTYWQEMGEGFLDTIRWIGEAAKGLLMLFVVALPVLVVIGVIVLVIILLARRSHKRRLEGGKKARRSRKTAAVPEPAPDSEPAPVTETEPETQTEPETPEE